MVKVLNFEVVHFDDFVLDDKGKRVRRKIILLYALGEDGVVYEMSAGKWLALPIEKGNMRFLSAPPERKDNNDA